MNVIDCFGETDLADGLEQAGRAWPGWVADDPRLEGPPGADGLHDWLRTVHPAEADRVLLALVKRGSPHGGDDPAAVWVIVSALLPTASMLAGQMRRTRPDAAALVAGQLWIELRSFPWWRLERVAANVLENVRSVVLRHGQLDRLSRTERLSAPAAPDWPVWRLLDQADQPPTAGAELAGLLADAQAAEVVSAGDVALLRSLVAYGYVAEERGPLLSRSCHGLLTSRALAAVGAEFGISASTVRRRARRSIDALAKNRDVCGKYLAVG